MRKQSLQAARWHGVRIAVFGKLLGNVSQHGRVRESITARRSPSVFCRGSPQSLRAASTTARLANPRPAASGVACRGFTEPQQRNLEAVYVVWRMCQDVATAARRRPTPSVQRRQAGPRSAVCNEPPKIRPSNRAITGRPNSATSHQPMPNRQRKTRESSTRRPAVRR
jgi:hypothetical protein